VRSLLEQAGMAHGELGVRFEPDADHGVERAEEVLLAEALGGSRSRVDDVWASLGDDRLAERLAPYVERLELAPGEVLIRQGDPPDDVYLLGSGELTVELESESGQRIRLRTVAPGSVVGEVAVYAGLARTATVVAHRASVVQRLSREAFARLEREEPDLAATIHRWFAKLLALRLADTLRSIDALLR
jgi:SulP family sulfate permease